MIDKLQFDCSSTEPGEARGIGQFPAKQAPIARRGIPANSIRRAETSDRSRGPKDVITPGQSVTHWLSAHADKKGTGFTAGTIPGGPNGVPITTGLPGPHWLSAHADKKPALRKQGGFSFTGQNAWTMWFPSFRRGPGWPLRAFPPICGCRPRGRAGCARARCRQISACRACSR